MKKLRLNDDLYRIVTALINRENELWLRDVRISCVRQYGAKWAEEWKSRKVAQ